MHKTLLKNTESTLEDLVTPQGIYASSNKGEKGRYHALFGRDSIITAAFIHETEKNLPSNRYLEKAAQSVLRLAIWQGKQEIPETAEQIGKIPHEIWEDSSQCEHLVEGRIQASLKPFYINKDKSYYVNWFSNDSTPLWIMQVIRLIRDGYIESSNELEKKMHLALEWCLRNIKDFDGLAGYAFDSNSNWHQPAIQSWKDSEGAFRYEDGSLPKPPIKDVGVNAVMWAALKYGALYFKAADSSFSDLLNKQATNLKTRFNNSKTGFLMNDQTSEFYFSDALDADNNQLKGIATDVAFGLWAMVEGESVIEEKYIPHVVQRIMSKDIFNTDVGVRVYSTKNKVFDWEEYHRGAETYWPFISGITAWGFRNAGYKKQADMILNSMLKGVERFNSCIEMFLRKDNEYVRFIDPHTKQESSSDQAWTAGALYYALHSL